ncbi:MAG: EAL domain-containing protein [Ectothiorhodospiraceae bacterium]|nr:EAL domain-containing protein [Ectothiorhodospiraceae bacterium]
MDTPTGDLARSLSGTQDGDVVATGLVLVADDDRVMRRMLRGVLESDGYAVSEVGDGLAMLEACRQFRPDLVLLDAAMPGLDGFAACATLRQVPGAQATPVVMITALDDDASMERALRAGATDYITKPVNWSLLRQRVRRVIQERRADRRAQYLAYHDALTGLGNRAHFMERLEAVLERARSQRQRAAVLYLDLDGFKLINDTLGHDTGDLLLKAVAGRLSGCLRDGDVVARLGGDEFSITLEGVEQRSQASAAANRVLDALAQPVSVNGRELFVGASIGIALFPDDGDDAVTLLKNADTAMYRAKDGGRNTAEFYTSAMGSQVQARVSLESSIRRALESDEFRVFYQPVVDLPSGRLLGFEALVRWQHPELGLVSPGEFVPVAEESGLINPLGLLVLERACRDCRAWQARSQRPVRVAVNLSGRQFAERDLVEVVARTLSRTGLAPTLLELEITENVVMQNTDDSVAMLRELKALGIHLAVDDFGTGYSSLAYLKRLPIDSLKIDRSFVHQIPDDADDSAIVQAVVAMAHSLRLRVVAEGVETVEQAAFLRGIGCDVAQGFLFGRPQPVEFAERLVEGDGRLLAPGGIGAVKAPRPASPVAVAAVVELGR